MAKRSSRGRERRDIFGGWWWVVGCGLLVELTCDGDM
jgi:hypothetical protein